MEIRAEKLRAIEIRPRRYGKICRTAEDTKSIERGAQIFFNKKKKKNTEYFISKAKEIGCCCIAEINALDRFGDKCACCNSCDGKTACIFVEQIALDLPLAKGTNTNKKHKCQHYFKKE